MDYINRGLAGYIYEYTTRCIYRQQNSAKAEKLIKTTVENKGYLNESEFVRNAIKEKLERELDLQRVLDYNGQLASGL